MILVSGYYGFANLGDEAILAALCNDLEELGIKRQDIVVLSAQPEETQAQHGVKALPRFDLYQIWHALGKARLLISGGGSLLQDATSSRSIPYYLGLIELAQLRKVPIVMYGQGVGPVRRPVFQRWVRRAFQLSAASSVRDQTSLELLVSFGLEPDKVKLFADPVFSQKSVENKAIQQDRVLLNLRPYAGWPSQERLWTSLLLVWQEQGLNIEFIPLGPGDGEIGLRLQALCPALTVHPQLTLARYPQVYAGAALCVSMRLHGIIFSALADVLPVGLNYDPKVEAISSQLGIPLWRLPELAGLETAVPKLMVDAETYRTSYQRALTELRQGALGNRTLLAKFVR